MPVQAMPVVPIHTPLSVHRLMFRLEVWNESKEA